jgi:ParB-like chromosome segregation protein Spo0J
VLRALAAIATATVLLAGLPARDGARLGTRTALAKRVRLASPSAAKTPAGAAALSAAEALRDELDILIGPGRCAYLQPVLRWAEQDVLTLECGQIGEHYGRYRLHLPEAERAMARSLERYGQLSPIVVCHRQERYELIDGFKRLGAARTLAQLSHLSARLLEADERTAKAAIYGLNRAGGRTRELEEAWIIQALVREDGMSQVEVAELLGRHKSWVCRRLALIERLGPTARDELRVGLLSPTAARQIVRLPEGNQAELLEAIRREALSGAELAGVVDLWLGCAERRQQEYLLRHPREALSQATGALPAVHDPRLSEDGNKVWKRVGLLLDVLGRMEVWLAHHGRTGLTPEDRVILIPRFQRLARDAGSVAALSQDFVGELEQA